MIDLSRIMIIPATEKEAETLTGISFEAKQIWNYPEYFYDVWKDELTISADYIGKNIVCCARYDDEIVGFYAIVENISEYFSGEVLVMKGFWMEHLFIKPEFQKFGIGRLLVEHAIQTAKEKGITKLMIFVDPFARGFYERVGAKFLYYSKSSIPGRLIPVYNLKID